MSAERMTTRGEANHIKAVVMSAVNELERDGYDRGAVGAAMIGMSAAILAVSAGSQSALEAIDSVRDAISAETRRKS